MVIPSLEDLKTFAAQANLPLFMKKSILTGRDQPLPSECLMIRNLIRSISI